MDGKAWSKGVTDDEAARRAGGRTWYNRQRQADAFLRQFEVAALLRQGVPQVEIAQRLGVSRSTIYRDKRLLFGRVVHEGLCPVCGHRFR
jgi:DNA-binding NarL/FixJ family response regulator